MLTSRSQSSTSSKRVKRLRYVDVLLSLLSCSPSPTHNIVETFSRKIDTDFHQINCSREGCTQQRVLKCVCVLQVAPSTLVPRPATPSTPATLISSNKQLKIKMEMFCFRLFDYAGERNYKESGGERVGSEWRNVK